MSELDVINLNIADLQRSLRTLASDEREMVKELSNLWKKHRELTPGVTDVKEESTAL